MLLIRSFEQVFLSQLYRRARLLNRPFQRAVIDTIRRKATLLQPAPPILSPAVENVGPPSPLVPDPAQPSLKFNEWAESSVPLMLPTHLSAATLNSLSSSEIGVCTLHWRSAQSAGSCDVKDSAINTTLAEWWAEVHPAPIKTTARMREKLAK
mmetsp:Transcript_33210/g.69572  ORF Transcript_33210/g.69572 Transcript_33210/m.69572 type:complete len:153 (+) Transcript_33210:677-1135(+)